MNKNKAIIIIIAAAAVIVFLLIRGCGKESSVAYRYEKADVGDVKKTISVTGSLEALNLHIVLSKLSGLVTEVKVDYNDKVDKGQLLAVLDDSAIEQELLKIDSKREVLANEVQIARSKYIAAKDLQGEVVSQRAADLAELEYNGKNTELKQALRDYDEVRKKMTFTKIVSPVAGMIYIKNVVPNRFVKENDVLFEVVEDMKQMQIIILVDESDNGIICKDQNVSFTVSAHPDKVFKGKITQVRNNPIIKDQQVFFQALVLCDNSEELLKPGYTATATVEVASKSNVLRVKSEALMQSPFEDYREEPDGKYVWRKIPMSLDSFPVEKVEVKVKLVGDYYTEIETGNIKPGDEILVGIDRTNGN